MSISIVVIFRKISEYLPSCVPLKQSRQSNQAGGVSGGAGGRQTGAVVLKFVQEEGDIITEQTQRRALYY